jgi:preprotein translocase subunit SecG
MYEFFVILAVITAVLLAFIVLIQESKGGGLASNFSSSNQIMGVRKTTDVIEKATWTLATLLVVFSVASAFCLGGAKQSAGSITDGVKTQTAAHQPAANQPAAPATETPAAPAAETAAPATEAAAPATEAPAAPAAETPAKPAAK